jgi:hypothetical protein
MDDDNRQRTSALGVADDNGLARGNTSRFLCELSRMGLITDDPDALAAQPGAAEALAEKHSGPPRRHYCWTPEGRQLARDWLAERQRRRRAAPDRHHRINLTAAHRQILEYLLEVEGVFWATDMAERVRLHHSVVSRMLRSLRREGWTTDDPDALRALGKAAEIPLAKGAGRKPHCYCWTPSGRDAARRLLARHNCVR